MAAFVSFCSLMSSKKQFRSSFTCSQRYTCSSSARVAPAVTDTFQRQVISMRSRRDLKKEKKLRNLEFAKLHRKRKERKRKVDQETLRVMDDNTFIKEVFSAEENTSD
ncbi:uncharacterized protein Gasu_46500 [Galdieria sulphuraria]|uniref:Uncharacterized protein n=1 Tax=Galdieria sulphuraria TaxID=130081 RepID=M2XW33_GALSU|nr:uncharacterized protein Gasu_46500 [Galdieria sulphuraria]EME27828.1 hypothetical protein Gasu_46500 [Galdieria sulphuraria]|eukprot:XP_005704348.1 hypothetical protein Gasu_46500 [Galdieria sulphuraria]